jgi:GTP-binding protein
VPEIAFAGRSNAGKSTAINILTNQKGLAFASKTPGRTQHINYFSIGGAHVGQHRKDPTIVDEIRACWSTCRATAMRKCRARQAALAKAAGRLRAAPRAAGRPGPDHGFAPPVHRPRHQMLEWFAPTGKPIHCILTKADKLNRNEQANVLREAKACSRAMSTRMAKASRSPCSCSRP